MESALLQFKERKVNRPYFALANDTPAPLHIRGKMISFVTGHWLGIPLRSHRRVFLCDTTTWWRTYHHAPWIEASLSRNQARSLLLLFGARIQSNYANSTSGQPTHPPRRHVNSPGYWWQGILEKSVGCIGETRYLSLGFGKEWGLEIRQKHALYSPNFIGKSK